MYTACTYIRTYIPEFTRLTLRAERTRGSLEVPLTLCRLGPRLRHRTFRVFSLFAVVSLAERKIIVSILATVDEQRGNAC